MSISDRVGGRAPQYDATLRDIRCVVSYRRHLLDAMLTWSTPLMTGVVLDLGGKRERPRGRFRAPAGTTYVNLDPCTKPDLLCDVTQVPWPDASADCVICTEVLEHLPDPAACVREAERLLRPGGVFLCSVPFLFPVHPDPEDMQRYTADGLRHLLRAFAGVEVRAMGGYLGTLGMMIEFGSREAKRAPVRRGMWETGRFLQWLDARRHTPVAPALTTGYFAIAYK
jgi:SAM-dependent methyltransferase